MTTAAHGAPVFLPVQPADPDDNLLPLTLVEIVEHFFTRGRRAQEAVDAQLRLEARRRQSPAMREWKRLVE